MSANRANQRSEKKQGAIINSASDLRNPESTVGVPIYKDGSENDNDTRPPVITNLVPSKECRLRTVCSVRNSLRSAAGGHDAVGVLRTLRAPFPRFPSAKRSRNRQRNERAGNAPSVRHRSLPRPGRANNLMQGGSQHVLHAARTRQGTVTVLFFGFFGF